MAIAERMPYLPFAERGTVVDGEFRWRLGARPLDLDDWLEFGPDADAWIAEKRRVLADHRRTAFAAIDGIDEEANEVADLIVDHLRSRGPSEDARLDPTLHRLEAAARLVPEDLVLMVERGSRLVVGGGVVCFPNRWDLRSKLGLEIAAVHAPVPGLNDQLGDAIDGFLNRLTVERPCWRLGWGLITTAAGYTPTDGSGPEFPAVPTPDDVHVRIERETLRRLPATNAVLFTIRTYLARLDDVLADRPSAHEPTTSATSASGSSAPESTLARETIREALDEAVLGMDPAVRRYKGITDPLIDLMRTLPTSPQD